jgi:D-glycerate 3-kinase
MADAGPDPVLFARLAELVTRHRTQREGLFVLGLCGAQGSGKSTLAAALARMLARDGTRTAILSLDDIYLTRAERLQLAREVHPLFATRGAPGTHDVALGLATIEALAQGAAVRLPRFDKGADDRAPQGRWPTAPAQTQVLLFEGWCLGAIAEPARRLTEPVNALEEDEDPHGIWRRYANAALAEAYQDLFGRIEALALLAAPGWDVVAHWREQQEAGLRQIGASRAMSPSEVARFVQHYERLTRWILEEMPARADLTVRLDAERGIVSL